MKNAKNKRVEENLSDKIPKWNRNKKRLSK